LSESQLVAQILRGVQRVEPLALGAKARLCSLAALLRPWVLKGHRYQ
jgi:hypothetical protein